MSGSITQLSTLKFFTSTLRENLRLMREFYYQISLFLEIPFVFL
jgi:hypothetical protein